jgi:methionine synthase II (cobalamin-independent)
MEFTPAFWTMHVGSFPHTESESLILDLISRIDIPGWPQLPKRNFRENMYVQFSSALPAVVMDEKREKIYFDVREDISDGLEAFYEKYLADDVASFSIPNEYSEGFYQHFSLMKAHPGEWIKGQVTGPVSFGLTVTDQNLRSILYHEFLADVIVKNVVMVARWQIKELQKVRPNVLISIDEPYMASFGSAYISLSRDQVLEMLNEIFDAIHNEGALSSVHCCANTDWSVLLSSNVDVVNLDSHGYIENLMLYPVEMREFLDRGGAIAWGLLPTNRLVLQSSPQEMADRLRADIAEMSSKARRHGVSITPDEFATRSIIAPACGLGTATISTAERVIELLLETAEILQSG